MKTGKQKDHYQNYKNTQSKIHRIVHRLFSKNPGRIIARDVARQAKIGKQTLYDHDCNITKALFRGNADIEKCFLTTLKGLKSHDVSRRQLFFQMTHFLYEYKDAILVQEDYFTRRLLESLFLDLKPLLNLRFPRYGDAFLQTADREYIEMLTEVILIWIYNTKCSPDKIEQCVDTLDKACRYITDWILSTNIHKLQ